MGIKGTVRRSTDGDFIHANVDIDLIISEEPEYGSLEKPVEIFHIIEHFCLGRRRYEKQNLLKDYVGLFISGKLHHTLFFSISNILISHCTLNIKIYIFEKQLSKCDLTKN